MAVEDPADKRLVGHRDGGVRAVRDRRSVGEPVQLIPRAGIDEWLRAIAFSRDGTKLASVEERCVQMWDLASGAIL